MDSKNIVQVANRVVQHWKTTKQVRLKDFRVIPDEAVTEFNSATQSLTFQAGVNDELTSLSFSDLVLTYAYLAHVSNNGIPNEQLRLIIDQDMESQHCTLQEIIDNCRFEPPNHKMS